MPPTIHETSRGHDYQGPDSDGLIEVSVSYPCIWLSKADLEAMLALFDEPKED